MRLIHSADLHLDAPLRSLALADPGLRSRVASASRSALERIVARCLEGDVAGLLLSGDIFDGNVTGMRAVAHFAEQMRLLKAAGVPVFLVRGNHDFAHRASVVMPLPDNVTVFPDSGGSARIGHEVVVHGVSFGARAVPESLLPRYPAPVPDCINIGLLHTSLAGSAVHDTYAPVSIEQLLGFGYDYWALGHIHARTVHAEGSAWIMMPGCPQGGEGSRDRGGARRRSAGAPHVGTRVRASDGEARGRRPCG